MKAILTKYIGPRQCHGGRIKAYDGDGNQKTIDYPHDEHDWQKRAAAVRALCAKMKWHGKLVCGWHKNETVWVFVDETTPTIEV